MMNKINVCSVCCVRVCVRTHLMKYRVSAKMAPHIQVEYGERTTYALRSRMVVSGVCISAAIVNQSIKIIIINVLARSGSPALRPFSAIVLLFSHYVRFAAVNSGDAIEK